jgi:hypothetical protein
LDAVFFTVSIGGVEVSGVCIDVGVAVVLWSDIPKACSVDDRLSKGSCVDIGLDVVIVFIIGILDVVRDRFNVDDFTDLTRIVGFRSSLITYKQIILFLH